MARSRRKSPHAEAEASVLDDLVYPVDHARDMPADLKSKGPEHFEAWSLLDEATVAHGECDLYPEEEFQFDIAVKSTDLRSERLVPSNQPDRSWLNV